LNDEAKIRKAQMPPSSNAWVPSVAGLIMGGHVVMELLKEKMTCTPFLMPSLRSLVRTTLAIGSVWVFEISAIH
jgi:hypothetical protein